MKHSILAHLGGRIARQPELLATEGLTYLLLRSEACSGVVRQAAARAGCYLPEAIRYRAEVSGEEMDRPDIVGTDDQNAEIVIVEGKFGAGLTENQPSAYIRRLARAKPGLLMFVVPELRVPSLWREIMARAKAAHDLGGQSQDLGGVRYCALNEQQALMMISWRALLDLMLHATQAAADVVAADVQQMQSLCARFEGEAFLPFISDELTGIHLPRRHRDLCDIVDRIISALHETGDVSLEGLKATAIRAGYVRYVWLGGRREGAGAAIGLMYDAWREFGQSPIWLFPQDNGMVALRPILEELAIAKDVHLGTQKGRPLLPLPIDAGLEFEEVVGRCVLTVRTVIGRMREASTAR